MRRFIGLSFLLLFGVVLVASAEDKDEMRFKYLRAATTGGFVEYEFFPDGKLIEYNCVKDFSESGDNVPVGLFESRYVIKSLRWKIDQNTLMIQEGGKWTSVRFREDGDRVYFSELAWKKIGRLEFFDDLHEYCEKSFLLKNDGNK